MDHTDARQLRLDLLGTFRGILNRARHDTADMAVAYDSYRAARAAYDSHQATPEVQEAAEFLKAFDDQEHELATVLRRHLEVEATQYRSLVAEIPAPARPTERSLIWVGARPLADDQIVYAVVVPDRSDHPDGLLVATACAGMVEALADDQTPTAPTAQRIESLPATVLFVTGSVLAAEDFIERMALISFDWDAVGFDVAPIPEPELIHAIAEDLGLCPRSCTPVTVGGDQ